MTALTPQPGRRPPCGKQAWARNISVTLSSARRPTLSRLRASNLPYRQSRPVAGPCAAFERTGSLFGKDRVVSEFDRMGSCLASPFPWNSCFGRKACQARDSRACPWCRSGVGASGQTVDPVTWANARGVVSRDRNRVTAVIPVTRAHARGAASQSGDASSPDTPSEPEMSLVRPRREPKHLPVPISPNSERARTSESYPTPGPYPVSRVLRGARRGGA